MNSKKIKLKVKSKIWLEKDEKPVFGIGRLRLLKAIDTEGSISRAAKKLNISYRRAWSHIKSSEENLGIKLLDKITGGKGGGSSTLTPRAKLLLKKFEKLAGENEKFVESRFENLFDNKV